MHIQPAPAVWVMDSSCNVSKLRYSLSHSLQSYLSRSRERMVWRNSLNDGDFTVPMSALVIQPVFATNDLEPFLRAD